MPATAAGSIHGGKQTGKRAHVHARIASMARKGGKSTSGKGKKMVRPPGAPIGKNVGSLAAGSRTFKKRKKRRGTGALQEIRKLQKKVELIMPFAVMKRLCKEISSELVSGQDHPNGMGWEPAAITDLQEWLEHYLYRLFDDSMVAGIHGRRVAVSKKDMMVAQRLRGDIE
tara:strand:+ start:5831 stop:6343 length:513 start_codon:yes stop_codon:yes gene_type:complete